jgi:23S rRNA (cytidine2498-2'-O)-methyltransferase
MGQEAISTSAPEFAAAGLRELARTAPAIQVAETLAPGVTRLRLPTTGSGPGGAPAHSAFPEFAERLRAHPPIFVRHLCPADRTVDLVLLPDPRAAPGALVEAASALIPRLDAARRFSVQTRILAGEWPFGPFDVNQALSAAIAAATGARLDVRQPEQVFSVVITADTSYLGLSRTEENLSAWAGGARRFARTPDQVSRSEFKLLEALEVFGLTLEGGTALDLGAAPGGWTRLLRERRFRVVAVDPAALDPRVAADRGVRHAALTAQEFLRQNRERFDLIVNDMRLDARDSARIMRQAVRALSPDGHAVMTLKLPTQQPEQVMHQALAHLLGPYRLLAARQLFHNRQEVTLLLAPRGERPAGD